MRLWSQNQMPHFFRNWSSFSMSWIFFHNCGELWGFEKPFSDTHPLCFAKAWQVQSTPYLPDTWTAGALPPGIQVRSSGGKFGRRRTNVSYGLKHAEAPKKFINVSKKIAICMLLLWLNNIYIYYTHLTYVVNLMWYQDISSIIIKSRFCTICPPGCYVLPNLIIWHGRGQRYATAESTHHGLPTAGPKRCWASPWRCPYPGLA